MEHEGAPEIVRSKELWTFHGAFYDHFQRTHTRTYLKAHGP